MEIAAPRCPSPVPDSPPRQAVGTTKPPDKTANNGPSQSHSTATTDPPPPPPTEEEILDKFGLLETVKPTSEASPPAKRRILTPEVQNRDNGSYKRHTIWEVAPTVLHYKRDLTALYYIVRDLDLDRAVAIGITKDNQVARIVRGDITRGIRPDHQDHITDVSNYQLRSYAERAYKTFLRHYDDV
jgi:hypothetical protein